jgi:hypothetical protein
MGRSRNFGTVHHEMAGYKASMTLAQCAAVKCFSSTELNSEDDKVELLLLVVAQTDLL